MQIVIDIDTVDYEYIKNGCIIPIKIDNHIYDAIRNGTPIPDNATRAEVHELIFGIRPPELDSPLTACALNNGCKKCKHKDDLNCDVNWWNAPYERSADETDNRD